MADYYSLMLFFGEGPAICTAFEIAIFIAARTRAVGLKCLIAHIGRKISRALVVPFAGKSTLIQVIILSALIMMFGLLKAKPAKDQQSS